MSGRLFQSGGRYFGATRRHSRHPVPPLLPFAGSNLLCGNEIISHGSDQTMYFQQQMHVTQPRTHFPGPHIRPGQAASPVQSSSYNAAEDLSQTQPRPLPPHRSLMSSAYIEQFNTAETPQQQGQGEPESQRFINLTNQGMLASNSPAHRSSVSTSSSFTTDDWAQDQQSFFDQLEEICSEGARRRWQSEIEQQQQQQQLYPSLNPRRAISCRARFEPYARARARALARPGPESQTGWSFMDYIGRIANATWEKARAAEVDRQRAEARAAEDMSCLYALAMGVKGAREEGWSGVVFEEERLRDVSMGARALCRFLGYEEGMARCDELMREWAGGEGFGGDGGE